MRDRLVTAPGRSDGPLIEYGDRIFETPGTGGVTDCIVETLR